MRLARRQEVLIPFAGPDWLFGQSTHASLAPNKWISVASKGRLRVIDLASRTSTLVDTPYQSMASLRTLSPASILVTGSPSTSPIVLAILTLGESDVSVEVLKSSSSASVDQDYISEGKPITYPTKPAEGESDDQVAYATFYEPANKLAVGLDGELPPLVVRCHGAFTALPSVRCLLISLLGGPTSSAKTGLDWLVQFFTSRGFAFVDVNYGGSVGFGRRFRKRLDKNWGIVDVQDTIACVQYLVKDGKADAKRVAITGTSAGALASLLFVGRSLTLECRWIYGAGCAVCRQGLWSRSEPLRRLRSRSPRRRDSQGPPFPLPSLPQLTRPRSSNLITSSTSSVVLPKKFPPTTKPALPSTTPLTSPHRSSSFRGLRTGSSFLRKRLAWWRRLGTLAGAPR